MLPYAQQTPVPFFSLLYYDSQIYKQTGILFYVFAVLLICYLCSSLALLLTPDPFFTLINLFSLLLGLTALRSCVRFTLLIYAFSSLILCVHMLVRFSSRIERPNFGYAADMQASVLAAVMNNLISNRQATIFPFIVMDALPFSPAGPHTQLNSTNQSFPQNNGDVDVATAYTYYSFLLRVPRTTSAPSSTGPLSQNGFRLIPEVSNFTSNNSIASVNSPQALSFNDVPASYIMANWKDLYELIRDSPSSWRITLEKICLCTTAACCLLGSILALLMQWKLKKIIQQRFQDAGTDNPLHHGTSPPIPPRNGGTVMILGYPNQDLNTFSMRYSGTGQNTLARTTGTTSPPTNTTRHPNFVPFAGDGVPLSNVTHSVQ